MNDPNSNNERRRTLAQVWEEGRLNEDSALQTRLVLTQSPVLFREIMALMLIVVLGDLALYRSYGFAGPAVLFSLAPLLLWLGTVRLKHESSVWILTTMLLLLSLRLLWCGSLLAVTTGFILLCCFSMSLSGIRPYITWTIAFASRLVAAGLYGLNHYAHSLSRFNPVFLQAHWFAVVLPLVTLVAFSAIFVMANPDLVKSCGQTLTRLVEMIERWTMHIQIAEVLFCGATAWIAAGLLRSGFHANDTANHAGNESPSKMMSPLYEGYRNTLAVVIGLFTFYLAFEFQTLWFKSFPRGFHYSGYAHEGAAWLTIALGLATILLSLIFRGTILADPRFHRLRTLSWIWSIQNLLLAVAVFNRLFIYIGFNGMTQMRVVGMLGVASVVGGFVLVLVKIARNCDFTWLIRRQLWTVSFAVYLYAVLPVDAFVNRFNVQRILSGDPAPCVQISVHPTSDEGLLWLGPLINCQDAVIRDGVRAILGDKLVTLEKTLPEQRRQGWTTIQVASQQLLEHLRSARSELTVDTDEKRHNATLQKFHDYAFQWY